MIVNRSEERDRELTSPLPPWLEAERAATAPPLPPPPDPTGLDFHETTRRHLTEAAESFAPQFRAELEHRSTPARKAREAIRAEELERRSKAARKAFEAHREEAV